jgi:hypothetical protein
MQAPAGGGVLAALTSDYDTRVVPSSAVAGSFGFLYVESCTAAGFVDPETGVCTNATNPQARECAYGSGESCVRCPLGALCPGELQPQWR